ncbi:beta-phosphoglucomutase family hydrolase [soil metagenome]
MDERRRNHQRPMSTLPYKAVIFDMDGVLTRTADVHAKAWKQMFDEFLARRSGSDNEPKLPFDIESDYKRYVDGKPRYDGARSFLESRGITLEEGGVGDSSDLETVSGLGNRKNEVFNELLDVEGPQVFEDAVEQLDAWREQGLKTALITSSRNGTAILKTTDLTHRFQVIIDGVEAARFGIRGKPAPDIFLEAARRLGVAPHEAVVIEDAISGVEAGCAGDFGLVVGVDRDGNSEGLQEHGADIVLTDLRELNLGTAADAIGERDLDTPHHRDLLPWQLIYREWKPEEQPLREALCALGNGHIVVRGAFEESDAGGVHYPGTYVAGGYNRLESEVAGRVVENEDLVNWPNWLPLTFRPEGGQWFELDSVEVQSFEQKLDVRRGILVRSVTFRDMDGREFSLVSRRLVHMGRPNIAAIEWRLKALNWSGNIEIRSALDGSVVNDNVKRYRGLSNRHHEVVGMGGEGDDGMYLSVQTNQSLARMTQAARTRVYEGDAPVSTRREQDEGDDIIAHRLIVPCQQQKELRIEKIVSIRTSYDHAISEPTIAACNDIRRAGSFDALLRSHEVKWRQLWSVSDIELHNGNVQTQMILRLHIFHLLQSTSTNTIGRDVGVPARGWHGEAYRGHIFWDELFIFPLLSLRIPELTRSLLMYRYRRLGEARCLAAEAGYEGAMYPWQSGSDGREESQIVHLNPESDRWVPDTTYMQRHVNSAIAFNIWEYYQASGDDEFLAYYGAEMLLEISRFWSSIATFDASIGRYVIRGVVGPDEFHTDDPNSEEPGLKNNAYTNVMAAWVLRTAVRVLDCVDEERKEKLKELLRIRDEELVRWDDISRKLLIPFHGAQIISQFEGYEKLEEFDWEGYAEKYGDIHRLDRLLEAEGDDVNRYKASKQADVLMLFFLFSVKELESLFEHLGYEFNKDILARNVDYYMERTSHGSTLSRIVHAWVLARSDREKAWSFWLEALHSDIEDIQGGTTPEGIHLGAMAGTVDIIHRGHTGLAMEDDTFWFDPMLPEELADVKMRIRFRGHWLTVMITQSQLIVSFDRGQLPAVKIGFKGEVFEMEQGETRTFEITHD